MPFVSEELIEKTWKKMGAMGGDEIQRLQKRHQKSQKALRMFVYSFLEDFPEDACGVLLFTYHVISEAFGNAKPRPRRVSKPLIEKVIGDLEFRASRSTTESIERSTEPFALNYVYEALTEESDVLLSKSEISSIFELHEVVIECLNRARSR